MRAKRGTIPSEKRQDGRLYVRIGDDYMQGEQRLHKRENSETSELIDQLRSEVQYLREENRRKDSIIMQMAQRIPELEAAPEQTPESSETSQHEPASHESTAPEQTQPEQEKRSWWRRLLGA